MTELKWIILTHSNTQKKVRIAQDKIISYYSNPAPRNILKIGSIVETVRGSYEVDETPDDIDTLVDGVFTSMT